MGKPSNSGRNYFTKAQKAEIVGEFEAGKLTCSELAGKYRISPVLIYRWRRSMRKKETDKPLDYKELLSELEEKDKRIECLQKALGDSMIRVQILEKTNSILKKNARLKRLSWQRKS